QDLERIGAEHIPAALLQPLLEFAFFGLLEHPFDEAAGAGRGVEENDAPRWAAAVFPRMRHVTRQEGAGARSAGRHLLADLERELSFEHPGDLIAVAGAAGATVLGAGRYSLFEQSDALAGLATEQLHRHDLAR